MLSDIFPAFLTPFKLHALTGKCATRKKNKKNKRGHGLPDAPHIDRAALTVVVDET